MSQPVLSKELRQAILDAVAEARKRRHEFVTLEHLLLSLLREKRAREVIEACGANLKRLQEELYLYLNQKLETLPPGSRIEPQQTAALARVLSLSFWHAESAGQAELESGDVLAALLQEEDSHARFLLEQQGVTRLAVLTYISHGVAEEEQLTAEKETEAPARDPLSSYTVDLVKLAEQGKLDPLIGRTAELERLVQVLSRRLKNNPLLVGDPGVGKTAIVHGLARLIHSGDIPEVMKESRIYALDMGLVLAGTKFRGQFEERIKGVLKALAGKRDAILLIDEIHTIVGAGAVSGGSVDAASLLKPALAAGDLRFIGTTTHEEFKTLERDRGLARRFQKIDVLEPTVEETVQILSGLRSHFESHHGVIYTDDAIRAAAELSAKHINERHLPDKAIDVLDEAGARQRIRPDSERQRELTRREMETVVAAMAKVPSESVSGDDRARLERLDAALREHIFGQDNAIDAIVAAIRLSRAGLRTANKPIGSFLFFGPTGVGKTELARVLSRALGVELLRYDMSEYSEKHTVSRLIGAPPGYVGFDQGGLLTDAVRRQPYAVLLLDEIEKAHPDLFSILLQVMDHATLTDNTGRKADFRNIVLIMTTNAGARELTAQPIGFRSEQVGDPAKKPIERLFNPEFRNRLDAIVRFDALSTETVERIVDKQIDELKATLQSRRVSLEITPSAHKWLEEHGYDRNFGARPMARLIDDRIRKPLAEALLFGALSQGGGETLVDAVDGDIRLSFKSTPT